MDYNFIEVSSDERRDINANSKVLAGKEVSIIKLHKNKAIGGCVHKRDEWFCILDGSIIALLGETIELVTRGQSMKIKKDTAHTFYAPNGAIVLEWGISPEDKQNQEKDIKHLELIKRINEQA